MAVRSAAPDPKSWYALVPPALRTDGPYWHYVVKVHAVADFIKAFIMNNFDWLQKTTGAKFLLVRYPEVIVKISQRFPDSTALPMRGIRFFEYYASPFVRLGICAKPYAAFMETRSKLTNIYNAYYAPAPIPYVVYTDGTQKPRFQNFQLGLWHYRAIVAGTVADWVISVSECENFFTRAFNIESRPIVAPISRFASPVLSVSTLYVEGSFLYRTYWLRNFETPDLKGKMDARPILGSLFKIALAVVGLSLDLFNRLGKNENKPFWLAPATFWLSLAPTFIIPLAHNYWPKLVVEPFLTTVKKSG